METDGDVSCCKNSCWGGVSVHVTATEAEKPAGRTTHMQIKSLIFEFILLKPGKAVFAPFADKFPVRTGVGILLIYGQIGIFLLARTESISVSVRAEVVFLPSRREKARASRTELMAQVIFSQNNKENSGRCILGRTALSHQLIIL